MLILAALPAAADDAELIFRLVPESRWSAGSSNPEHLPAGRVLFYREGEFAPRYVLEANRVGSVPAGSWAWVAEAEGYVSVVGGTLRIPEDHRQEQPKVIYWPVVPACQVVLDGSSGWRAVDRLDLVSVSSNAVYPVLPGERAEAWVPAGRILAYGVGSRGLLGISDLGSCTPRQRVRVAPPGPPDRRHQDLMVTAYLPTGVAPTSRDAISISLDQTRGTKIRPTALVIVGDRVSAFFLGIPVDDEYELAVRHPESRSSFARVPPLGGSARELSTLRLRPRRSLTIEVDYRPLRPHDRAEIRGYWCGRSRRLDARSFGSCVPLSQRPSIRPGLHEYVFESLDDGKYYFEAWIDDFLVPELGAWITPYLDPSEEEVPLLDRALLHEQEIEGEVRLDGEAVEGSVRLLSIYEGRRRLPDHRFLTDETGAFRLFYFGRQPGPYAKPPGFRDSSDPSRTLGLYGDYQLLACTVDGFCRPYSVHSVLQGSGRLVLDIGDVAPIEVHVSDEKTGEPVEDALLLVPAPAEALYFHHGEVDWFEPSGTEGAYVRTGKDGLGRLLSNARASSVLLTVHHPDYLTVRETFGVVPGGRNRLHVALTAREEITTGRRFAFPDGTAVADGYLLLVDPATGIHGRCSTTINSKGYADLSDSCLRDRIVVLVAPGARISIIDGSTLTAYGDVKVPRAPMEPVVIRVLDSDGEPLPGVPIELRYPQVTLGPNELLLAGTYTGYQAFYLTNERGEISLRGVDPEAPIVPDVRVLGNPKARWEPLSPYRRGETVVLTVDGD